MHHRWREWKETRSTPARNQFNAVRNSFYTTIREAKSKNWDDFLQSARGKEVFTAMRYTKPRRVDPTPDITLGEEKAKTFKEKAQLFRKALFPPPPTKAPCPLQPQRKKKPHQIFRQAFFSLAENPSFPASPPLLQRKK